MAPLSERPSALLVDDDALVLKALGMLLDVLGWHTTEAFDADKALALLGEQSFELAIIDFRMPNMDGIELCRQIRGQGGENPPIIFLLSGYLDPKSQAEAENSGAQEILLKPIGLEDMKNALKKFGLPCGDR